MIINLFCFLTYVNPLTTMFLLYVNPIALLKQLCYGSLYFYSYNKNNELYNFSQLVGEIMK